MIIKIYNELNEVKILEGVKSFQRSYMAGDLAYDIFQRLFADEDDIKGSFVLELEGILQAYTLHPAYKVYVCNDNGRTIETIKVPS